MKPLQSEQRGHRHRVPMYLPTWRLIIVIGMYGASVVQVGALIIFTIEQKPIHPIGNLLLLVGCATCAILGRLYGRKDLQRIREQGGYLEVTRVQGLVLSLCCGMVPGTLLILVLLSL